MGLTGWFTLSSRTRGRRRRARRVLWEALECRVVPALSLQPTGLPLDETSLTEPVTQTPVLDPAPALSTTDPVLSDAPLSLLGWSPTSPTPPQSNLLSPAPAPSTLPLLDDLLSSFFSPDDDEPDKSESDDTESVEESSLDKDKSGSKQDRDNRPGRITRGTPPGSRADTDPTLDDSTIASSLLVRSVSGTRPNRGPTPPEVDRGGSRQPELTPESESTPEDASQPIPIEEASDKVLYGKRNLLRKAGVKAPLPADEVGQPDAEVAPSETDEAESARQAGFVAADPLLLILAAGAAVAGTWSQTKRGQVLVARVRDAAFRSRRWLEHTLWRA